MSTQRENESASVRRFYDSEVIGALAALPAIDAQDLAALREHSAANFLHFRRTSDELVDIVDEMVPTNEAEIRARAYIPRSGFNGGLLWLHGGAFVLGSPEIDDDFCRHLALRHKRLVIAPDYRLAPEHPYPAAEIDSLATLDFIFERLAGSGGAGHVTIAGASAGGGLALSVALEAARRGREIDRLVLAYPVVDSSLTSESMRRYEKAPIFDGAHARLMWRRYLNGRDATSWRSPMHETDLDRLPMTMVVTTEHDPLRDEGLDLVRALLSAGVSVQALLVAGSYHAFDRFAPDSRLAKTFREALDEFLERPTLVLADC